jgi:hypothetical protein
MPLVSGDARGLFARMSAWLRSQIQTVPPEMARCEFECRTSECDTDRFDNCERRIDYAGKMASDSDGASAPPPAAPVNNS